MFALIVDAQSNALGMSGEQAAESLRLVCCTVFGCWLLTCVAVVAVAVICSSTPVEK